MVSSGGSKNQLEPMTPASSGRVFNRAAAAAQLRSQPASLKSDRSRASVCVSSQGRQPPAWTQPISGPGPRPPSMCRTTSPGPTGEDRSSIWVLLPGTLSASETRTSLAQKSGSYGSAPLSR